MPLIALVYVSFASHPLTDAEIFDILKVSRDNNVCRQITGMLLYRDRFFVQVLEGEAAVVESTFEKISTDPRHERVLRVYGNQIEARTFSNWSMGFNKFDESLQNPPEGYTNFLAHPEADYFIEKPSRIAQMLVSFRDSTYF